MTSKDLDKAVDTFAQSIDLTVGIEEEFAILDPTVLDLVPRFEHLRACASERDPLLGSAITGELISSEIEIVSGRGENLGDALSRQREHRRRLFALVGEETAALERRELIRGPTTVSSRSLTPSTTDVSSRV